MITVGLSPKGSTAITRFISNVILCAVFATNATAQNTMGPIEKNEGIITQGQIGNNYILKGTLPPSVEIVGEPKINEVRGHYFWTAVVEIKAGFAVNNLTVGIKKDDIIPSNDVYFFIGPDNNGGNTMSIGEYGGENSEYYVEKYPTPPAGKYRIVAQLKSKDIKPTFSADVNR